MKELALARLRYGYRRLRVLLRRAGWMVNPKRVLRLYREEGLTLRIPRKKRKYASWVALDAATHFPAARVTLVLLAVSWRAHEARGSPS